MKFTQHLINAFAGWGAGVLTTILFGLLWKQIFPVIERTGEGASMLPLAVFILVILTPITIAGGVIGGRIPREGDHKQILFYAALFGALFSLPFSCFLFWYTGW